MDGVRSLEGHYGRQNGQQRHSQYMVPAPDDSIRVSVEIPTTRVYAHVTAETQVALHNPMASQKVNPLADKYQFNQPIATLDDNAFLEVYPRSSSRQPQLLQQLELLLQDKLHQGQKLASPYGPGHRDPAVADNLRLHAHREVWEAFINSFGTYKPLMAGIKTEYDAALHGALKASAENMSMRTQLADAEERKAKSVDQVKMEVTSSIANVMLELHNRLLATEERAVSAEAWAAAAEEEAAAARQAADKAKAEADRCKAMHDKMMARKTDEETWLSSPGSKNVKNVQVGAVDEPEQAVAEGGSG